MYSPAERRALRDQLRMAKWQIFGSLLTTFGSIMFASAITLMTITSPMSTEGEAWMVITVVYFTMLLGGLFMLAMGFYLPHRVFSEVEKALDEMDNEEP